MLIGDLSLVFICGRIPSNHNHLRYLCVILSGESGRSELSEFYPADPVICASFAWLARRAVNRDEDVSNPEHFAKIRVNPFHLCHLCSIR